ncbi:hypothetical protein [Tepidimicrobium xylanilyticum]
MTHNTKAILRDVNGKPVPQYWNPETQQYEVIESKDGMLRVIMVDSEGREIQTQNLIDQINAKLDELIEAVINSGV